MDWKWLVAKIEKHVKLSSFKWLSRAGHLVLIKSVLQTILVYWITLSWVAKGIPSQIKKICGRIIWAGPKEDDVLPWVTWEKIARPKDKGRWGIKDLSCFSHSLAAKSGWSLLTKDKLWTLVIKKKYLDPLELVVWLRTPGKSYSNSLVIWKAMIESFDIVVDGLS